MMLLGILYYIVLKASRIRIPMKKRTLLLALAKVLVLVLEII